MTISDYVPIVWHFPLKTFPDIGVHDFPWQFPMTISHSDFPWCSPNFSFMQHSTTHNFRFIQPIHSDSYISIYIYIHITYYILYIIYYILYIIYYILYIIYYILYIIYYISYIIYYILYIIYYILYIIYTYVCFPLTKTSPILPPAQHHQVLGLQPGASSAAVRRAYHCLALLHHPDKGGGTLPWGSVSFFCQRSLWCSYFLMGNWWETWGHQQFLRGKWWQSMGCPWDFFTTKVGSFFDVFCLRNGIGSWTSRCWCTLGLKHRASKIQLFTSFFGWPQKLGMKGVVFFDSSYIHNHNYLMIITRITIMIIVIMNMILTTLF